MFLSDDEARERFRAVLTDDTVHGRDSVVAALMSNPRVLDVLVKGHAFGRSLAQDAYQKLSDGTVRERPLAVMLSFMFVARIMARARPVIPTVGLTSDSFYRFASALAMQVVDATVMERVSKYAEESKAKKQQEEEKEHGKPVV